MDTVTGDVLLVGSVPLNSAEEVLRVCAEGVGDLVPSLPDGEVNFRIEWINFLAAKIYSEHPSLETTSRPKDVDGKPGWVPTGYDDHWIFKVKPGLDSVHFDNLGYAAQAKDSYETFRALRQEGVIPANVRFQVSLPLTESATRWFLTNAEDFAILWDAYEEAMGRELATIQSDIPTDDLLIQWDICMEVLAIDTNDQREGLSAWVPPGDPLDRYLRAITAVAAHVVDEVPMGLHLCYGDLLHAHLVEPKDLGVVVGIANDSVREIERQVDFVHEPPCRGGATMMRTFSPWRTSTSALPSSSSVWSTTPTASMGACAGSRRLKNTLRASGSQPSADSGAARPRPSRNYSRSTAVWQRGCNSLVAHHPFSTALNPCVLLPRCSQLLGDQLAVLHY